MVNGDAMLNLLEVAVMIGASLCCALFAVFLIRWLTPEPQVFESPPPEPMSFLFDDGVLHHATQNALTTFALLPGAHVWSDLRNSLLGRFPQFPEAATNAAIGSMTVRPLHKDDHGLLKVNWRENLCWVELCEANGGTAEPVERPDQYHVMERASETSPHPSWETLPGGMIGWRNAAYDELVKRSGAEASKALFQTSADEVSQRLPLKIKSELAEWFDVSSHQNGTGMLHHATKVTSLQRAEDAQRTFVQTLAKTFAQLPIGLAIFDQSAQLSIFNPALVELTGLDAEYLVSKPTMLSFFDALRENRRMPEPKNYNTWRNQITAMIAAATDGQYNETWTLEDGRTYTVQGRPHPDGAIAFLIEDISAEVTLTRNFKTEVEQYEALLNTVEDAMVVFSAGGVITYSNTAYRLMWNQNPEKAFADVTVQDAITQWQSKADGDWSKMVNFIRTLRSTNAMDVPLKFHDNRELIAQMTPIGSETTLIRFREVKQGSENKLSKTG